MTIFARLLAVGALAAALLTGRVAGAAGAPANRPPAPARTSCGSATAAPCSVVLPTGVTMRYLDIGPARGPVTVLLHGFADSRVAWSLVVPQLQRLMPWERLLIPDLRGQGDTSQPSVGQCAAHPADCFRPVDYAADVLALMDAVHVGRAAIIGHSVGSLVAQEIALDVPQRVSRLVLISTGVDGQQPLVQAVQNYVVEGEWRQDFTAAGYPWPDGVYDLAPGLAVPDFDAFVDDEYETSSVAPPALLSALRAGAKTVRLGTWIGTLDDLVVADNTARLQRLSVPTLMLWAVQDDVFAPAAEQKLIDSLQVSAASGNPFWWKQYGVLLPTDSGEQTDLGHNLPWEAPSGVAADAAAFLVTGAPTCTLYRTDYPEDIHRVLAVPGAATIIHGGRGRSCSRQR